MLIPFKSNTHKKILLSLECNSLRYELAQLLTIEGYIVKEEINSEKILEFAKEFEPHMIFVGFNNFQHGINVCKEIRENKQLNKSLIMIVSNYEEECWESLAFESGVNDYILKPIKPRALLGRIKSYFTGKSNAILQLGEIQFHTNSLNLYIKNQKIILTKKELELFIFLIQNPNRIFTRHELFDKVWKNNDLLLNDRTVDVHINRIREKIGKEYIQTLIRVGYKFVI